MSVSTSPMPRIRPAMRSGWNCSKASSFSPVEANAIGLPMTSLTRQRRAAAGVAVELGQDHAVDGQRLVERLGHADRVLTGHRVDDEERVVRGRRRRRSCRTCSIISASIGRRPAVSTMSTSRPSRRASARPLAAVIDRVAGLGEHRHVDLAAERAQLLDGGGALEVGADEQRVGGPGLEPAGQLGRVRRLAGALQTGHQHDRRRPAGVGDLERLAAEDAGELAVDDLDDLLARVEGLRAGGADGLARGCGRRRRGRRRR